MKHIGPISGVASHEKYIATAGYDNCIILWDAITNIPISMARHDHLVNQIAFSPDGEKIASASSDYSVRIWEVPSLRLLSISEENSDDVEMVMFSPDSTKIATCSRDRTVRVLDSSCRQIAAMTGHSDDAISVAWSSCGQHVYSSSDDGTVRQWSVTSGLEISKYNCDGVQTDALVVTSQGAIILGDDNGKLIIISEGREQKIQAHTSGIKRVILSEKYKRLATLSYDRSMVIWSIENLANVTEITRTAYPSIVWARSGAFYDADLIVTGTFGSTYAQYKISQNAWECSRVESYKSFNAVGEFDGSIYSIGDSGVLYKDGKKFNEFGSLCNFLLGTNTHLLTGGQLGQIFDAVSGEILYQHNSPINCGTTFNSNGKIYYAFGTYSGEMVLLENTLKGISYVLTKKIHSNAIKGIVANSKHIFSVSASMEAAYLSTDSFEIEELYEHAHDRIANGCVTFRDGFASISRDLSLRLWVDKKATVIRSPHRNSIKCVASSDSGDIIATGSYGGAIFFYDTIANAWTHGSRPTISGISSLTFSKLLDAFIASSYDGKNYYFKKSDISKPSGIESNISARGFYA